MPRDLCIHLQLCPSLLKEVYQPLKDDILLMDTHALDSMLLSILELFIMPRDQLGQDNVSTTWARLCSAVLEFLLLFQLCPFLKEVYQPLKDDILHLDTLLLENMLVLVMVLFIMPRDLCIHLQLCPSLLKEVYQPLK